MSVSNIEKRCKASHSEFQEIWPGLKRCMVCGFALATEDSKERSDEPGKENKPKYPKEDTLHSTYHGKFYKAKAQYGYSNVLEYKLLKEKEEAIGDKLKLIKQNDISDECPKFKEFFVKLFEMLQEVRRWNKSFKDIPNLTVQSLNDGIRNNVNEIWALCRKGEKVEDISELIKITQEILPIYRNLFDTIQSVEGVKNSNVTKDYDDVPNPNFSFDIAKETDAFEMFMQVIPTKQNRVDGILNDLYAIEFTRSLRLWDMCKPHPKFEDYVALLWNTPKFLNFIKPYMTENQFNTYVEKYKCNRQLVDYKIDTAPFYFGRVILSSVCEEHKAKKECKGKCSKCPFGYIDLTYTDKLTEVSDEDDDISDGYENTGEYKQIAEVMTALGQVLNK